MTKEDKQIIDRAVKEEWRTGDRSRLKRLLKKNLELYRENVELEQKLEQTEKDLADYQFNYPTIKELEKENTELKKEVEKHKWNNIFLEDCAGFDKKIAEEYTTSQERIEKLEQENTGLKEELKNWKDEWQEQVQKAIDEGYARTLQTIQLTKAIGIIKRWYETNRSACIEPSQELIEVTEQFLKEIEK